MTLDIPTTHSVTRSEPETITLLGCGDIAQRLALELAKSDHYKLTGIRRSASESPHIEYRQADATSLSSLRHAMPEYSDVIVITMTPSERSDEGYRQAYVLSAQNLLQVLEHQQSPRLILFVSSTSVYAQSSGEWVDETSPTLPTSFSGKRLLEAEQVLATSPYNTSVVRFSGIYGPGRHRVVQQVRDGKGVATEPVLYSNRIHVDDCAAILAHLIQKHDLEPLYIASDSNPSPLAQVTEWMAEQLGFDESHLVTAPTPSTGRASKRCRNTRLLNSGFTFEYPTFQQGYTQVLNLIKAAEHG